MPQQSGKKNVPVIGVDANSDNLKAILSGDIYASIAQGNYDMGRLAVEKRTGNHRRQDDRQAHRFRRDHHHQGKCPSPAGFPPDQQAFQCNHRLLRWQPGGEEISPCHTC